MERFNKSYELSVILMLFVIVIDGIRGDMNNRIDAEQEPFVTVNIADGSGAKSTLFASCLISSSTIDAKFYSIETSDATNEFFRYVPDSSMLAVPPEWKTVTRNPPVMTIADCADAAHSGGNPMFKYSGGSDCKVSNQSYDLKSQPNSEAIEQDAVFISSSAVVACPLPRKSMVAIEGTDYICIFVNYGPLSFIDGAKWCSRKFGSIYSGPYKLAQFIDLVKVLKDMKVESGNFAVSASYNGNKIWKWMEGSTPIDPALMVSGPSSSGGDIPFISAADGFKVDFAPEATFKGGVVCTRDFKSP